MLLGTGTVALASLTGCTGSVSNMFETSPGNTPPLVENRPDAVYVPTHMEGMNMVGMGSLGDMKIGLMYSYPHRFWTVGKENDESVTNQVNIRQEDSVHLMAIPWDGETGTVLPNTGLSIEILRDGELVSEEVIYPMLSQRMGFHYGANFSLDGDGTYDVTANVGGVGIPRYGSFEGKFGSAAETTVTFEFSERELNDISYQLLRDKQGQRGAMKSMEMEMIPTGYAPTRFRAHRWGREPAATPYSSGASSKPSGSVPGRTSLFPPVHHTTDSSFPEWRCLRPSTAPTPSDSLRRSTPNSTSTTARSSRVSRPIAR
jgi:uncharacterized protein involved in high-affinity Fe2+ transport